MNLWFLLLIPSFRQSWSFKEHEQAAPRNRHELCFFLHEVAMVHMKLHTVSYEVVDILVLGPKYP